MKLGFIGMGNMAGAIVTGIHLKKIMSEEDILAYAPNQDKLKENALKLGFTALSDIKDLVDQSDVIVMACKPYQIDQVLSETKGNLKGKAILSVAAGWGYDRYSQLLGEAVRIQCIMPNTPLAVGQGMVLFEEANSFTDTELDFALGLFNKMGSTLTLPTNLMDAGMAISGCGPAFMDLIMEAYGDAAVKYGIKRADAYKLIAQTMAGAASLQLETGEHPGVLKDKVCSPNGTTILGVEALEHAGLRSACLDSVNAILGGR